MKEKLKKNLKLWNKLENKLKKNSKKLKEEKIKKIELNVHTKKLYKALKNKLKGEF